jgi:hypothetical protein
MSHVSGVIKFTNSDIKKIMLNNLTEEVLVKLRSSRNKQLLSLYATLSQKRQGDIAIIDVEKIPTLATEIDIEVISVGNAVVISTAKWVRIYEDDLMSEFPSCGNKKIYPFGSNLIITASYKELEIRDKNMALLISRLFDDSVNSLTTSGNNILVNTSSNLTLVNFNEENNTLIDILSIDFTSSFNVKSGIHCNLICITDRGTTTLYDMQGNEIKKLTGEIIHIDNHHILKYQRGYLSSVRLDSESIRLYLKYSYFGDESDYNFQISLSNGHYTMLKKHIIYLVNKELEIVKQLFLRYGTNFQYTSKAISVKLGSEVSKERFILYFVVWRIILSIKKLKI